MDRKLRRFFISFLALQLLLPVCKGLGLVIGKPFSLHLPVLLIPAMAGISLYLTSYLSQNTPSRWFCLAFPAVLCNALVLLLEGVLGGIAGILSICCGWALLKCCPKGFLRGLCYGLSWLLTVGFVLILPLWGFAQMMRHTRVIRNIPSPDSSYTAIVTSVDQGALGGDTLVDVRDNKRSVNILVGSFVCSERIWQGGWGDHEGMTLRWEDETMLEIDGISYNVSGEDVSLIAEISHTLGAEISRGQLLDHQDTHGGFHGDGKTFVTIRADVRIPDSRFWHPLPATKNIADAIALCIDENHTPLIPEIQNGWYFFRDRHSESIDPSSDAAIHQRSSWNFTLGVYDSDRNILYYFELDT